MGVVRRLWGGCERLKNLLVEVVVLSGELLHVVVVLRRHGLPFPRHQLEGVLLLVVGVAWMVSVVGVVGLAGGIGWCEVVWLMWYGCCVA